MSDKEKKIFKLCKALVDLLGREDATADLKKIYERHTEMFKDMQDLEKMIEKVVSEPEIIIDAKRKENYGVFKALKQLDNEKMGDVIVKNQNEMNKIFHANKKKIRELTRFKKKLTDKENLVGGRDAHSLHPDENQVWATDISSMCSPTSNEIIPQESNFNKENLENNETKSQNKPNSPFSKIKQNLANIRKNLEKNKNAISNEDFTKEDLKDLAQELNQENSKHSQDFSKENSKENKNNKTRRLK